MKKPNYFLQIIVMTVIFGAILSGFEICTSFKAVGIGLILSFFFCLLATIESHLRPKN